ncbi:hypothetical protein, partial [Candidatus Symbiopectobacterium sp. NZEC135]|uniref:hypothetical protein n=1 Tax=Candidatus Symbiopectobacterium sp. NZEC135 TaxID=2820471 RepID=UPI00222624B2
IYPVSETGNNSNANTLPLMVSALNKINNSSLNLYGGSVVERSGFFAPSTSTIKASAQAATTCCHAIYGRAISYGDAACYSPSFNNRTVSRTHLPPDIQPVSRREVISQSSLTAEAVSRIQESTRAHEMRKKQGLRTQYFVRNLSTTIVMLSRAGIDIPDGMSPHTIYCKYTREKRQAELLGYHFNKADFQHRINIQATRRLPELINQYHSSNVMALNIFSALHSRSAQ